MDVSDLSQISRRSPYVVLVSRLRIEILIILWAFSKRPHIPGLSKIRSPRNDNKISRQSNFQIQNFSVVAFPEKNSVLDDFPLYPTHNPPSKMQIFFLLSSRKIIYTEQMDTEGLGRKLLLTPSGDPRRAPEKQTVGTVTTSHKMLTLQALSSSLNVGTAKRSSMG